MHHTSIRGAEMGLPVYPTTEISRKQPHTIYQGLKKSPFKDLVVFFLFGIHKLLADAKPSIPWL